MITRKGGKVVTIPLAPRPARAIGLAISERCEGPVFLAADGRRPDRHGAARIVRQVTRRAGITKLGGPHTLRHAFITAALDAGVPLRDVQEAASHADPRTTMRYDRARGSSDRHTTYIVAAYVAGAARSTLWQAATVPTGRPRTGQADNRKFLSKDHAAAYHITKRKRSKPHEPPIRTGRGHDWLLPVAARIWIICVPSLGWAPCTTAGLGSPGPGSLPYRAPALAGVPGCGGLQGEDRPRSELIARFPLRGADCLPSRRQSARSASDARREPPPCPALGSLSPNLTSAPMAC